MNQVIDVIEGIEILRSDLPVPYPEAIAWMESRVQQIIDGTAPQALWFLEHPPTYTAGTSARPEDLVDAGGIPVYQTGRGGQFTYHGPGQRVVYVMLDLNRRPAPKTRDIRAFVKDMEQWIIATLAEYGIEGEMREGRVGVWVKEGLSESKIAAIGIRVRHWVTFHGIAINVSPDLAHFQGIVPCGIKEYGVTSFRDLSLPVAMESLDHTLRTRFRTLLTL